MIGFNGIEVATNRDHAVPGTIWFKIVRFRILHRIRFLERAQIGNQGPCAIRVHANDSVWNVLHAVGATSPGEQRIKRVVNEGNVGHAADE